MLDPRRIYHSVVAGALGVCFLISMLGAHLHQATARHGYCSDHGELVHVPPEFPSESEVSHGSGVEGDEHLVAGHDCAMEAFLAQCYQLQLSCGLGQPSRASSVLSTSALCDAIHAIPLLHLSPKNSPPPGMMAA